MTADAIVLLGCRIEPGGEPGPAARRRAARAARAYREGVAPWVLVSGGRRWWGVPEADALARELERLDVPPELIVAERCSVTTSENARYSARLLLERRAERVALVTCDFHLPRALASFRAVGVDALGLPALSPPAPLARALSRGARERVSAWLGARR
ncbi:MAG: YdcF family protein [Sorangiineae bacterium]|nr:YdcF family protein [Polyangiaceae bacterium]MEB2324374.1 YdcF family protein [Sorangiineae bacterium]